MRQKTVSKIKKFSMQMRTKKKIMIIIYNIYIYIVIIVIGNKIFTGVAFLVPKSRFTKMYIDV